MAFDGITVAGMTKELKDTLEGGRISKIAQPETDELLLTVKTPDGQKRLCISASASLPLIYLTSGNKPSPMTAPNFCMLLRKHISNGRIVSVTQPENPGRRNHGQAQQYHLLCGGRHHSGQH